MNVQTPSSSISSLSDPANAMVEQDRQILQTSCATATHDAEYYFADGMVIFLVRFMCSNVSFKLLWLIVIAGGGQAIQNPPVLSRAGLGILQRPVRMPPSAWRGRRGEDRRESNPTGGGHCGRI